MAVVLDATPGSATANSYSTVAEANAYHDSLLYPGDWATATDPTKVNALITATRILDENINWMGTQTAFGQSLGWPRAGVVNRGGYLITSTTIPQAVKNATAEFARLLIEAGSLPNAEGDVPAGLKRLKAGSVEVEYEANIVAQGGDDLPSSVTSILNFLIESRTSRRTNVPLVRA